VLDFTFAGGEWRFAEFAARTLAEAPPVHRQMIPLGARKP